MFSSPYVISSWWALQACPQCQSSIPGEQSSLRLLLVSSQVAFGSLFQKEGSADILWASLRHSEVQKNALCGLFWWPSLEVIEKGQQTLIKPHLMSWKVSVMFLLQYSSSLNSSSWVSQKHLQPEGDHVYSVTAFPDLDAIRVANLCSLPLWQEVANPLENSLVQPFLFAFAMEAYFL